MDSLPNQESVYQLRLVQARQATIPLDEKVLRSRKKNALEKIEWMQLYAESMVCREVFLRRILEKPSRRIVGIVIIVSELNNPGGKV